MSARTRCGSQPETTTSWYTSIASLARSTLYGVTKQLRALQVDQVRQRRYLAVKEEVEKLEAEMKGYDCDAMVKEHLRALNEYNARKDAASVIIGKISDIEQSTIAEIYKRLDLELDD